MGFKHQPTGAPKVLTWFVWIVLIAFPALLLVVSSGGSTPYHLAAIVGLVCLAIRRPRLPRLLTDDEKIARLGFYAFTAAVLISLFETGFRRDAVKELDVLLRPLWALPVLYLLLRVRTPECLLWFGLALGAIVAGSSAFYETMRAVNYVRANGATSAITFGNTALLMGVMAAIGMPYFRRFGNAYVLIPVIALIFGLAASLLSGSRGGWLALPALGLLLLWHFWREGFRKVSLMAGTLLVCCVVLGVAIPHTGVVDRGEEAVVQFEKYLDDPELYGDTTVGVRLGLWQAAWEMFYEYPVFGGGIGHSFNRFLKEGIELGQYHPSLAVQTMPHNVFLDTLALQGIVGLLGLVGIWGALSLVFARAARDPSAPIRRLGMAGIAMIVAYVLFGMTDSVMGYGPPLVFFCFYSAQIVYRIAESRLNQSSSGNLV